MTTTQRAAMHTIIAIRNLNTKYIESQGKVATEYVSVFSLINVHKIRSATIDALVKAGYLEKQSTDGYGPEVKVLVNW